MFISLHGNAAVKHGRSVGAWCKASTRHQLDVTRYNILIMCSPRKMSRHRRCYGAPRPEPLSGSSWLHANREVIRCMRVNTVRGGHRYFLVARSCEVPHGCPYACRDFLSLAVSVHPQREWRTHNRQRQTKRRSSGTVSGEHARQVHHKTRPTEAVEASHRRQTRQSGNNGSSHGPRCRGARHCV